MRRDGRRAATIFSECGDWASQFAVVLPWAKLISVMGDELSQQPGIDWVAFTAAMSEGIPMRKENASLKRVEYQCLRGNRDCARF